MSSEASLSRHPIVVAVFGGLVLAVVGFALQVKQFESEQYLIYVRESALRLADAADADRRESFSRTERLFDSYQADFAAYHNALEGWLQRYRRSANSESPEELQARAALDAATSRLTAALDLVPLVLTAGEDPGLPMREPIDRIKKISHKEKNSRAALERAEEVRIAVDSQLIPQHRRVLARIAAELHARPPSVAGPPPSGLDDTPWSWWPLELLAGCLTRRCSRRTPTEASRPAPPVWAELAHQSAELPCAAMNSLTSGPALAAERPIR